VVLKQRQQHKAQTPAYERGLWLSTSATPTPSFELGQPRLESIRLESNNFRFVMSALSYSLDKRQADHEGTVSGKSGVRL